MTRKKHTHKKRHHRKGVSGLAKKYKSSSAGGVRKTGTVHVKGYTRSYPRG